MAIQIQINAKEPRDTNRQVVFFTITKNANTWKFSHGGVPSSLTTDAQIKTWLSARKDKIIELIQAKIANGTYRNEHPSWIKALAEIDAISNLADVKAFLEKLVKYVGK